MMLKLKASIQNILQQTEHRPWPLPDGPWIYYQEWVDAVFLHWEVDDRELRKFVPANLELDLIDGKPWVSVVAFTMSRVRPRFLPAFQPVSYFHEINIRTYVKHMGKSGVYFLSIEAANSVSSFIAKKLSELPYRFSKINRSPGKFYSKNIATKEELNLEFEIGPEISNKSQIDAQLTERYALFQDSGKHINSFDIHHLEWPLNSVKISSLSLSYPRFGSLLSGIPKLTHYSPGIQVIAWNKQKHSTHI